MWRHGWLALALIASTACRPAVSTREFVTEEFESTYSTADRHDPPAVAEHDAPLAGSLGQPEDPVQPLMPGPTTTTAEGSSGPPIRELSTMPLQPVREGAIVRGPAGRVNLRGVNTDSHRQPRWLPVTNRDGRDPPSD